MAFNKINPINYNFHKINKSGLGQRGTKTPLVSIEPIGFYLNMGAATKMQKESDYFQVYFDSDNDIVLLAISDKTSSGASKLASNGGTGRSLSNKNAMREITTNNPHLNLRNYTYKWELKEYIDNDLAGFIFSPKSEPYSKSLRRKPINF